MIAVNQVVVTAPALRADIANACSSFDTSAILESSAGVRSGRTCSNIETDKAPGDKEPDDLGNHDRQEIAARRHLHLQHQPRR
jgi:hypothetical protein